MNKNILVVEKDKLNPLGEEAADNICRLLGNRIKRKVKVSKLEKECLIGIDSIWGLGGDGTMLSIASYVIETPIILINIEPWDSEGVLSCLKKPNPKRVKEVLEGDYKIIQRQRAETLYNNRILPELALNEVRVGVEKMKDCAHYIVEFNGEREQHRSWGIIIATGSGSTGLYGSLGGKRFPYDSKNLGFRVIAGGKNKLYRPRLLKSGEINFKERIKLEGLRFGGGEVSIDSRACYRFNAGDICEVYLSDKPLNVIVPLS